VPKLRKLLKLGARAGPVPAIFTAITGTVIRQAMRNTARDRIAGKPSAASNMEWMMGAKEEAKRWLRENNAPERLRDFAEHVLSADLRHSSTIVETKIKPKPTK